VLYEIDTRGHAQACLPHTVVPDGAYTTLRTYGGFGVLRLERHVARLSESAALQGRPGTLDPQRVRLGLLAALQAARLPEARLRVTFAPPRLLVATAEFEALPADLYEQGVACATLALRRDAPHAKDTRFLSRADAARAALPPGAHEGLMVDAQDGAILEGLSSNFLALCAGELRTEPERVLHGVTRGIVLELGAGLRPLRLAPVTLAELPRVDEAMLTSVSRGVLPVVRIDGTTLGDGRPGPVTRALREGLDQLVAREARDLRAG
jgi:branched-chain amino acid aminotransferase